MGGGIIGRKGDGITFFKDNDERDVRPEEDVLRERGIVIISGDRLV
jgi:hypothetical protein